MEFLLAIIELITALAKGWEEYQKRPRQTCLTGAIALVLVMVIIGVILATRP